ncbi:beta-sandwich domain-containing protein [Fodinibius sp. N2]|uniref:beta-sandwich domain-containing protein n=1 Tax=Fodinibius alkaliphilus TaxID=3140241 RepID=UPI003159DD16
MNWFKKTTIFSAVILLIGMTIMAGNAVAQENVEVSLTGEVVDASTQEALSGVQLTLEGADKETTSSDDGSFTFEMVSAGTYTLTATADGYEDWEQEVEVKESGNSITVELQPKDY